MENHHAVASGANRDYVLLSAAGLIVQHNPVSA
jgi:hypothetical protein